MYQLVREREVSPCSTRHCRRALSSSTACVQRMELQQRLEGHHGCVNTVSFDTEAGDILISGSDDMQIMLWDWERATPRLTFRSGHSNNVFQARMMPHTGGSRIVTCAADGQVRLCELPQGAGSASVSTSLLGQHYSRAHKLALDPLCPAHCFYSCGEDGLVMHYDLRCGAGVPGDVGNGGSGSSGGMGGGGRSGARRKLLACRSYSSSRGMSREVCGINAIHVNPLMPHHFALGAADPWTRVYDIRRTRDEAATDLIGPLTRQQAQGRQAGSTHRSAVLADEPLALLCPQHLSRGASPGSLIGDPHVTCVVYSRQGELLASYNDEDIYLFSAQAAKGSLGGSTNSIGGGGSSSGRRGAGDGGSNGAGSSGTGSSAQQAAGAAAQQQQQQQQAGAEGFKQSPSRRPREAAGGPTAAAAAAAADGSGGVRYVEEEEERPRWRRRQRLVTTAEANAAAAAAAGTAAGDTGQDAEQQQQQQQDEEMGQQQQQDGEQRRQQPSVAEASPGDGSSASREQPSTDRHSPTPAGAAAAAARPGQQADGPSPSGPTAPAAAAAAAAAAAVGGVHLPEGLSAYEGVQGARFYDADSSSRDGVVASYYGHRNSATVKGVSFFGEEDEYVCSGSDCGHVFLWDKARGTVVFWEEGDAEVVNCLEPHPHLPLVLATSGIEHDIKLWGPTAPGPQPPPAAALRRAMAANQRERQAARDAYSEPEHWLVQLLAAQRRRTMAARRRRAAAAAGTAAATAAGGTDQPTAAAEAEEGGEEGEEEEEEPLLLPPGGVRIVWSGPGGRQRRRQQQHGEEEGEGAESGEGALSSSDGEEDGEGDDSMDGDDSDGQPCHIS